MVGEFPAVTQRALIACVYVRLSDAVEVSALFRTLSGTQTTSLFMNLSDFAIF